MHLAIYKYSVVTFSGDTQNLASVYYITVMQLLQYTALKETAS